VVIVNVDTEFDTWIQSSNAGLRGITFAINVIRVLDNISDYVMADHVWQCRYRNFLNKN